MVKEERVGQSEVQLAQHDLVASVPKLALAFVFAFLLVAARIFTVTANEGPVFWYLWSGFIGVISFASPLSGIAITFSNIFVSLSDESPLGLSIGQLAGLSASIRLFLQLAIRKVTIPNVLRPSHMILFFLIIVVLLSSFFSPYATIPFRLIFKIILIFILSILMLVFVNDFKKLHFLAITVALSAGLAAIATLLDPNSADVLASRVTGLTGNPNYQAVYLSVAVPLSISLLIYSQFRFWHLLLLVIILINIFAIVATASRGGMLTLVISLIWTTLILKNQSKKSSAIVLFLLLVISFTLAQNQYANERIADTIFSVQQGNANSLSRVQLANDSISIWEKYPVLGVGAGNWYTAVINLETRSGISRSSHVWPAQVLAELGIAGVILYLFFVYFCMVDYHRVINYLKAKQSRNVLLIQGFMASALTLSLAWTSGNPFNQLWFALLLLGPNFVVILDYSFSIREGAVNSAT